MITMKTFKWCTCKYAKNLDRNENLQIHHDTLDNDHNY